MAIGLKVSIRKELLRLHEKILEKTVLKTANYAKIMINYSQTCCRKRHKNLIFCLIVWGFVQLTAGGLSTMEHNPDIHNVFWNNTRVDYDCTQECGKKCEECKEKINIQCGDDNACRRKFDDDLFKCEAAYKDCNKKCIAAYYNLPATDRIVCNSISEGRVFGKVVLNLFCVDKIGIIEPVAIENGGPNNDNATD